MPPDGAVRKFGGMMSPNVVPGEVKTWEAASRTPSGDLNPISAKLLSLQTSVKGATPPPPSSRMWSSQGREREMSQSVSRLIEPLSPSRLTSSHHIPTSISSEIWRNRRVRMPTQQIEQPPSSVVIQRVLDIDIDTERDNQQIFSTIRKHQSDVPLNQDDVSTAYTLASGTFNKSNSSQLHQLSPGSIRRNIYSNNPTNTITSIRKEVKKDVDEEVIVVEDSPEGKLEQQVQDLKGEVSELKDMLKQALQNNSTTGIEYAHPPPTIRVEMEPLPLTQVEQIRPSVALPLSPRPISLEPLLSESLNASPPAPYFTSNDPNEWEVSQPTTRGESPIRLSSSFRHPTSPRKPTVVELLRMRHISDNGPAANYLSR